MRTVADYEQSLIGSLLMNPSRMAEVISERVESSWFVDDVMSLAWDAFANFWRAGKIEQASPVTVMAEIKRLAAAKDERRSAENLAVAIEAAIDKASLSPVDVVVRLLRNAHLEDRAKKAVKDSFELFPVHADAADVLMMLRGKMDGILGNIADTKKIAPRVVFESIMTEYNEAHRMRVAADGPRDLNWTPGIKMPWLKMTRDMVGLRAGLHVIAARPSVGKTSFAVNLMRFWCESGVPVLFNSLDMPRIEVMRRFIAEKARVSARKASFSPTHDDLEAMNRATADMASWPLTVTEIRDVDELMTMVMIERSAGRLGVLVVDYLQLLHARYLGREDAVEYARVSYVSDTLKRLANELQVPVVALAQLNREVAKQDAQGRVPGLSDLRGSGSIEQDAFSVTILHRDQAVVDKWRRGERQQVVQRLIPGAIENPAYHYNSTDLDCIWWVLAKNQNGPTGKLPFLVRKKYFAWMLGDYEATADETDVGYGATARKQIDNTPYFARVHRDWRHDPIEEVLRLQLALCTEHNLGEAEM